MSHTNCCVYGCSNSYRNTVNSKIKIKFHKFPFQPWEAKRKDKWIHFVNRMGADGKPWKPYPKATVCSAHFIGNKKSDDPRSPSYLPTIHPANQSDSVQETKSERSNRMDDIDCCWLCWKSLPKTKKIKTRSIGEPELDSSLPPARTYLENCVKYLNLEIDNLEEMTMEFKTCPLCLNCLESAKKLTGIVDELEKLKKELETHCFTFLENLKRDRESIRLENMKLIKTNRKRCKKVKPTGDELMPENNEESVMKLESEEIDFDNLEDDSGSENFEHLKEKNSESESFEQLEDDENSSILDNDSKVKPTVDELMSENEEESGIKLESEEIDRSNFDENTDLEDFEQFKEDTKSESFEQLEDDEDFLILNDQQASSKIRKDVEAGTIKNLNKKGTKRSYTISRRQNKFPASAHKGIHVQPNKKCEMCDETFRNATLLKSHFVKDHQTERPYKCSFCPKSFKLNSELRRHEIPHKTGRSHLCKICGKAFFRAKNLASHHKCVHEKSKNITSEVNKYPCDQCGKVLKSSKTAFEDHMRLHTGEKPFKCEDCGEYFRTKLNLQVHRAKEHLNEYPYQCDQCEMQFKMKNQLVQHRTKLHIQPDELIICEDCGKSFKRRGDYIAHRQVMHDKVKYKCEHCDKTFSRISELRFHVKVVHTKEIELACHICGRESSSKRKLRDHLRTHSGEKPYQCKECDKHFISIGALSWHRHHSASHRLPPTE